MDSSYVDVIRYNLFIYHNSMHAWVDVKLIFKFQTIWTIFNMLLLVHVTKTIQIYCYKIRTNCENTYQIETFPNHKNQQIHIPRASPFHGGNNLLMPLNCDVVNLKSRESHWENPHYHVVSLWIVAS